MILWELLTHCEVKLHASEDGTGRGTPLMPVYLPDTANTLTSRMSKGINTEVNEGRRPSLSQGAMTVEMPQKI